MNTTSIWGHSQRHDAANSAPPVSTQLVLRLRPRRAWLPRAPEATLGCGWHESSRELLQGLEVTEWLGDTAPRSLAAA